MLETAFTRLVGCPVPIQQTGMGGVATPELAAAAARAGALGMVNLVMVLLASSRRRLTAWPMRRVVPSASTS
jgi:NAD(P)H-dependent flavin oxidoreductase YrpB (nitropropane dioxygenase family)